MRFFLWRQRWQPQRKGERERGKERKRWKNMAWSKLGKITFNKFYRLSNIYNIEYSIPVGDAVQPSNTKKLYIEFKITSPRIHFFLFTRWTGIFAIVCSKLKCWRRFDFFSRIHYFFAEKPNLLNEKPNALVFFYGKNCLLWPFLPVYSSKLDLALNSLLLSRNLRWIQLNKCIWKMWNVKLGIKRVFLNQSTQVDNIMVAKQSKATFIFFSSTLCLCF